MRIALTRAAALGMTAAFAVTGVASANAGHRSYAHTFPVASTLCAKVASGNTPKRLKGQEGKITQDCNALESSYTQAVNTVLTAEQTYKSGVRTDRATQRQTCEHAPKPRGKACRDARHTANQEIRVLRQDRRIAVIQYHQSIESARQSFWSSIRALRGGSSITPDRPQPNAPVPSN